VSIEFETSQSQELKSNEWVGREWNSIDPNEDFSEKVIHHGFCCDECNEDPIVGIRYHCSQCEDYDLCRKCYQKSVHNHEFEEFRQVKGAVRASMNNSQENVLKNIRRSYRKID
jgi:hypothetical protein